MDHKKVFNGISGKISKYADSKPFRTVFLIGIAGFLLLLLPSGNSNGDSRAEENSASSEIIYREDQLEEKLTDLLSQIDGVGRVSVLVTYDDTGKNIYVTEGSRSEEDRLGNEGIQKSSESVNIVSGADKSPILETFLSPSVKGVVVVCDGGDNSIVKERVIQTVSVALQIRSSHIYVTKTSQKGE